MFTIPFHPFPYSLAKSLGDIVSVGLFCQLVICAICLAVYMLAFESNRVINVNFLVSIVGSTSIIASTYIYCYFSETVTSNLKDIGDIFYEFHWYRLPLEQQQLFILSIHRAQEKYRMTGLKLVECSLSTFSSVDRFGCVFKCIFISINGNIIGNVSFTQIIRAAWSYFLVMHGFE